MEYWWFRNVILQGEIPNGSRVFWVLDERNDCPAPAKSKLKSFLCTLEHIQTILDALLSFVLECQLVS